MTDQTRHIVSRGPRTEIPCVVECGKRLAAAAAGGGAAGCLHALSDPCHHQAQLFHRATKWRRAVRRFRQLSGDVRGRDLLESADQQFLVCARHRPDLDRAGAADGALGQSQHARARVSAARLFHADRAADDRGGQHLAVLLHAGLWIARSVARTDGAAGLELARRSLDRDGLPDRHGDLEGGRLLHDLLSCSAAAACRPISRKRRRSRAQAAGTRSGASRFRC